MKLSGYRTTVNKHRVTQILAVEEESSQVKRFKFKDGLCAKSRPGQFLMLWVPKVDEIPLSILDAETDNSVSVAVKKVGEATEALHCMKVGDKIGVRGPFGNSFTLNYGKVLMVGGGTGVAPLLFLAKKLRGKTKRLVFVTGAKTENELLFIDELGEVCGENLVITTEDGVRGVKGLATDPLETILAKEKFDFIYTCGPEQMMRKVFEIAERHGLPMEASLERLMRCAVGICGSCVVGKYRVCRDGPVFNLGQLKSAKEEFGFLKRDFNGKKVPLE